MNRQRIILLALAALTFLFGGALGWRLRGPVEPAPGAPAVAPALAPVAGHAVSPAPGATDAALVQSIQAGELRDLRAENQELRERLRRMQQSQLAKTPAPDGVLTLEDVSLDALDFSGRALSPKLIAYLGLEPEAAQEVDRQLDSIIEETERRLCDGAKVDTSSPEKVVITSPAFPEAVAAMQGRLEATVRGAAEGEQADQLLFFLERSRGRPRGEAEFNLSYQKVTGAEGVTMLRITRPLDSGGTVTSQTRLTPEIRQDASVRGTQVFLPLLPAGFLP